MKLGISANGNTVGYPAFILAISTGMQQSETMSLYWRAPETPTSETAWGVVNLAKSCIILHETKNGDRRHVPLTGLALAEQQKLTQVRRRVDGRYCRRVGPRTLDIVKRYAHLSDGHIADVVERMNNRLLSISNLKEQP